MNIVRRLEKKGRRFVVRFDEDGALDTIERDREPLSAADADAQTILRHDQEIRANRLPDRMAKFGWEFA